MDIYNKSNKKFIEEKYNENQVEGRNSILEVLKNGRDIEKIFIQKGNIEGTIKKIIAIAKEKGIIIQEISKQKIDSISQTKNHQGVIAIVSAYNYSDIDDILKNAKQKQELPFIIILDGITDPHNFGAIIRTAEVSGAHGIIIPKRRSVGLTATVAKTSVGALEYIPIVKVTNIAKTIEYLKNKNIWTICADISGMDYFEQDMKTGIAIVIGNEGNGVSNIVKKNCDFIVSIPMYGKISSLNASVSAGLFMYEVVRQRNYT